MSQRREPHPTKPQEILEDDQYPPWLFPLMIHQGNLYEQTTKYFSPFDYDVPKHYDMKALVRKMKKENIKIKKLRKSMKTADEEVS